MKLVDVLLKEGASQANGLVISLVLISSGFCMMIDHIGLSKHDSDFFSLIGTMFLITGIVCIILQVIILKREIQSYTGVKQ